MHNGIHKLPNQTPTNVLEVAQSYCDDFSVCKNVMFFETISNDVKVTLYTQ